MKKWPPLFLSSKRQKTEGESKSGLKVIGQCIIQNTFQLYSPAHIVNTSINSHKCTSVHIANHSIVLDGEIP